MIQKHFYFWRSKHLLIICLRCGVVSGEAATWRWRSSPAWTRSPGWGRSRSTRPACSGTTTSSDSSPLTTKMMEPGRSCGWSPTTWSMAACSTSCPGNACKGNKLSDFVWTSPQVLLNFRLNTSVFSNYILSVIVTVVFRLGTSPSWNTWHSGKACDSA